MAFPVGALPDPGQISILQDVQCPFKSAAFTGGGSDLDLTDPTKLCVPCATEFVCTTTGNLVAVLAGDVGPAPYSSPVSHTYALTAGNVLKGIFVLAKGSSTANGIFRQ